MAFWDIRIVHQPPMRVEVSDDRNLVEEFLGVLNLRRSFLQWVSREPVYWQVTDTVCLERDSVLGVEGVARGRRARKPPIGFKVGDPA